MVKFLKYVLNKISPNLSKKIRKLKIYLIQNSIPQISSDKSIMFWGAVSYENYEPAVTKVLMNHVEKSNIFINIGANSGIHCLNLASYVEIVYAFEPLRENLNLLYKNIENNNLTKKIIVYPVVLGSQETVVKFYGASTGGSLLKGWNSQLDDGQSLSQFSLDFLLYDKLKNKNALVLIDVEGAEYEVILGAEKIIKNLNSVFCIEIPCREFMPDEIFNKNFKDIFYFFKNCGYYAWEVLENGELLVLTDDAISDYISINRFHGLMAFFSKDINALVY